MNLTHGQQLLWLGQQLHPDVPLYNMIFTFTIDGPIDLEAFQSSFQVLVSASEILRTVIKERGGEVQQIVLETMPQGVEFIDLSNEANPQLALDAWVDKRRARLVQMDTCLFDSVLLKLGETRFVWYFSQHHIVMDVWSSQLIFRHMSELYRQAASGQALISPNIPAYSEYVSHEAKVHSTDTFQKAAAYWQKKSPTEPVSFYGDHGTPTTPRTERRSVYWNLSARLKEVAKLPGIRSFTEDLTYSNIFAALILAFLHRLSSNDRLRLGMPFANRDSATFRETLGLFIEVLSLEVEFEPGETFRSLLKKVAAANIQTLQNLQPGVGTAEHNRAYDVLLNYIATSFSDFAGLPTEAVWVHSGYGDSNHKLRIQVHDLNRRGEFEVLMDFNTETFTENDQNLAIEHFSRIADACLDNPDILLNHISLLSPDEWRQFIQDFNATDTLYPAEKTIVDLFEEQVQRTPDAIALRLDDATMSYTELNNQANVIAQELVKAGVRPETPVPIHISHSFEMMIALLAVLKAGGAYVPLNPAYPDERIQGLLEELGDIPLIIAQSDLTFDGYRVFVVEANTKETVPNPSRIANPENLAYMIFTSGTTGKPKGVMVQHSGLTNYLWWACQQYTDGQSLTFALYSSLAFDLTVTSLYVPLISGGAIRIYPDRGKRGMIIRDIVEENLVDVIKLTPSHLELIRDIDLSQTRLQTLIVGGEEFRTNLAMAIHRQSNGQITQYNEYGPTEATVACMVHKYQPQEDVRVSVPIGTPSDNMRIYVLDQHLQPTPTGVIGELYLSGINVSRGYYNISSESFLEDPFTPERRMYRTGDLARWLPSGQLEFLGRRDQQVKVGGVRIELGEIETALHSHPAIRSAVVDTQQVERTQQAEPEQIIHCQRCGLPSNYPGITFDEQQICSICHSFDSYKDKAQQYFKNLDELRAIVEQIKANRTGDYDGVVLLSGGKDSTYMLHQLVNMGLRLLAFTLDNGYISDEAKANIRRSTEALGVEHIFAETPFMNAIFSDSLRRFANVCNGCFKTIYTMAVNLAREKGIPVIFTGLSRGQFFETRLTEELFTRDDFEVSNIDESIARARKAYHQRDDIISRSLQVDVFRDESVFDIQFIDFYRYCDVDLETVYEFLEQHAPWQRPSDTGRSTNCLINEVGIHIHKKRRGFHNYALPYSWDVRMGHKTRDEAIAELDDDIDENRVHRILREIGYHEPVMPKVTQERLVAYYVSDQPLAAADLRGHLSKTLPDYMLPTHFVALDELPLSPNGKVNKTLLPSIDESRLTITVAYSPPTTELEETLVELWQEIMGLEQVGIHDNFFELGGHSLPAVRIASRIRKVFDIPFSLDEFFANPTVAQLADTVEEILIDEIDALSEEEVQQLLMDMSNE